MGKTTAEDATAPETLRPPGPFESQNAGKRVSYDPAEGVSQAIVIIAGSISQAQETAGGTFSGRFAALGMCV